MRASKGDRETLEKGLPYIRSIAALLLYFHPRISSIEAAYTKADVFIDKLKEDME